MRFRIKAVAFMLAIAALPMSGTAADLSGQERAVLAGSGLIGSPAPRLVIGTIDGKKIDLGSLYGKKAVYLKFWATWCVPCREQMPHFQHSYESRGKDLEVIAINAGFNDSLADIDNYRKHLGITMPIALDDGRLGEAFHLRVTPQHIVIDRTGRISYVGHLADARLDEALKLARQSESSAPAHTVASAIRSPPHHLQVSDLLPDRAVRTLEDAPFSLRGDTQRRPTVLVFLSPWCESYLKESRPAVAERCRVARLTVAELSKDSRVRWLGVASGLWATADDVASYQQDYAVRIPLTVDESGALFRAFGVTDTPTVIVANREGVIVRRLDAGEAADDALAKVVGAL